ncbi:MAG: bifunctional ornithine acetyltransferase/N-acetylglutamate synthase [Chloroflexi bacterium]|nr:MAG: bifunctional ornithine acetyltransferase/N-acetylglutamate synthase [Chloroflexota bacterium]
MNIFKNGTVTTPQGFQAAAVAAKIKYKDRDDLVLIVSETDCAATAVFTKNQVVAAPVIVDKDTLAQNNTTICAVLINAGNANASTGKPGLQNARITQELTAKALNRHPNQVLIMSTGVIGVQLPMDKMAVGIPSAAQQLSRKNGRSAAEAIMTTDTVPKHLAVAVELSGGTVTIGGMAKGSGMIHPDMATMLSLLTTDAIIAPDVLDSLLKTAVNQSFNRISIDGDTSTNDTVLLLANGASGVAIHSHTDAEAFSEALNVLCRQLAQWIVKDGEGATKFVEIQVSGTETSKDAHTIANTIATSPLVKTALAGSDANWGRLLMAAGRAGIPFDPHKVDLWIGAKQPYELHLVNQGTPTHYREEEAAAIFAQAEFIISLQLGEGNAADTVWTCDLSHDYVTINADYRT